MYFSPIILVLLSAPVLAMEVFTYDTPFDGLSRRGHLLNKRQVYAPNSTSCGQGGSCEEACGRDQAECPSSNPTTLYCHSSTDGSTCCPGGISCRTGFWCAADSKQKPYCCPNDINATECAHQYAAVSQNPTPSTAVLASSGVSSTLAVSASSASIPASTPVLTFASPSGLLNYTATGSPIPQFTGGSVKATRPKIALLAGGAGLIFL